MLLIRNANIKTMAGPDLKNGCSPSGSSRRARWAARDPPDLRARKGRPRREHKPRRAGSIPAALSIGGG